MNAIARPNRFRISEAEIRRLLERDRHRYWRQMNAPLIRELLDGIDAWPAPPAPDPHPGRHEDGHKMQWLAGYLAHAVGVHSERIAGLERRNADFHRRCERCVTEEEKQHLLLDYARELGAGPAQLAGDARAFRRWFDRQAILDRYRKRLHATERALCFRLDCLAAAAVWLLRTDGPVLGHDRLWRRLNLEAALTPLFRYHGDPRVATAAFRTLASSLSCLPQVAHERSIGQDHLVFVLQNALDPERDTWLQCEALALLASLAPHAFHVAAAKRLTHPREGNDLFVRRRAVLLIGEHLAAQPELRVLLPAALHDPSAYVRQALCQVLCGSEVATAEQWLPRLLREDAEASVRGAALFGLSRRLEVCQAGLDWVLEQLAEVLAGERDAWVLRAAMQVATETAERLEGEALARWCAVLDPALEALHCHAESLATRRRAAQARERLWCEEHPAARALKGELLEFLERVPRSATRALPRRLRRTDEALLGRVLAVLAQDDFGYDVELGKWRGFLTRGHVFGFRCWRFLHEWRNPAPEKRQAYPHTRGRLFFGNLRAPSPRLAELAETRVPGEPLHRAEEDGWRPYLPLPDEVLSCLGRSETVRIYTSEGITEMQPPANPARRWHARWELSRRFTRYARLRNFDERGQGRPEEYVQALGRLGIRIRQRPYGTAPAAEDPAVRRFFPDFPALFALPAPRDLWDAWEEYFVSVYGNSLFDLGLYLGAALLWFLGRHIRQFQRLSRARRRLALVVGGWGTRGKSGTERLKAALFNALGYGIVSKTTGCEAMFLHAHPFGELREMFLFRPYDKATIWEQHNLVLLAGAMGSEVFLWECMALTPSYVRLLQRQWMRDDLATLTNAYPDHEDIQGPAGIDIPEVMAQFIPEAATLLTSEEQMLPVFREEARRVGTRLHAVGWREAGLLAPDVLGRFSYDEHPYNVALVLALARELQVPEEFALKEMADRVVPDLGVLKTFPAAPRRGRRLEFINGMSANERFGCLGNWQRVGLAGHDYEQTPDRWVTVVVNNRADRVARSRVFAGIVVQDLRYDCLVLIGNNLNGLLAFIGEAWNEWFAGLGPDAGADSARLEEYARRLHVPYRPQHVRARLAAMLDGLAPGAEKTADLLDLWDRPPALAAALQAFGLPCAGEVARFVERDLRRLEEYRSLAAGSPAREALRARLWGWFRERIEVVWDYHATGDQVVEFICDACPPGLYNRVMGIQNIKGTGLDFVYRWQAWDQCRRACRLIDSGQPLQFAQGLRDLARFTEYGLLCEETVRSLVSRVRLAPLAQEELHQAELNRILENLEASMAEVRSGTPAAPARQWLRRLSDVVESVLDASDAVRRRKRADLIYRDLAAERIAHARAAQELKALNQRQKGHWLYERLPKPGG